MTSEHPVPPKRRAPRVEIAGWTALVTGASSGIGAEFARALAARGVHLVLTARRTEHLQQLSGEIREAHAGVEVTVLTADLAQPGSPARLVEELAAAGLAVDLLVNNAGFGSHEPVVDEDPARVVDQIQVNCIALAELTTRLLPAMVARGRGGVLNVASTAAFQPVATMAVYAATKAFVLSFTEALWAETRRSGVRVLALCPGATSTEFFATVGREFLTRGRQTPTRVVEVGLAAFTCGHAPSVVSGAKNRVVAQGHRFVPRALVARLSAGTVRSG